MTPQPTQGGRTAAPAWLLPVSCLPTTCPLHPPTVTSHGVQTTPCSPHSHLSYTAASPFPYSPPHKRRVFPSTCGGFLCHSKGSVHTRTPPLTWPKPAPIHPVTLLPKWAEPGSHLCAFPLRPLLSEPPIKVHLRPTAHTQPPGAPALGHSLSSCCHSTSGTRGYCWPLLDLKYPLRIDQGPSLVSFW